MVINGKVINGNKWNYNNGKNGKLNGIKSSINL